MTDFLDFVVYDLINGAPGRQVRRILRFRRKMYRLIGHLKRGPERDVFDELVARIVHADVAGERLSQVNAAEALRKQKEA